MGTPGTRRNIPPNGSWSRLAADTIPRSTPPARAGCREGTPPVPSLVRRRLAARLRAANPGGDGVNYDFPLTQEQIADCTGLTAVHTNRTLQGLRRDGVISLSSSRLTILDWDRLAEIGDFNERYLHHSV